MQIALMNTGRNLLIQSLAGGTKPVVDSFVVGSQTDFTPDPSLTGPAPVYTGTQNNIAKSIVNPSEIVFYAILPNTVELASVGNIMLRCGGVPFAWFVLRKPLAKKSVNNIKHFAGDLQYQAMVIQIPNIVNLLNTANNPDFYAKPKIFNDLDALPRPLLAGAREVIVQDTDYVYNKDRPVYAVNIKNQWWGAPGMKNINDPNFNDFSGGVVGDGYT